MTELSKGKKDPTDNEESLYEAGVKAYAEKNNISIEDAANKALEQLYNQETETYDPHAKRAVDIYKKIAEKYSKKEDK